MTLRVLCATLMLVCLALSAEGQNRHHDDRSVQERANRLEPFIVAAARRYHVDTRILRAICFVESRYRINVVSPKGARGPMQFMPGTAARYGVNDPHNPQQAFDAGARYLRDLLKRFDGRVDLALAAYNAGEGTVNSFLTGQPLVLKSGKIVNARGSVTGGIPPYMETQKYVRTVLTLVSADVPFKTGEATVSLPSNRPKHFTLDVIDYSDRDHKSVSKRPSHFIDVH
jgi:soluble lytic murein transglycosylase-like protein